MEREQIFTIKFTEGMANRHRLPINHVIDTLREIIETVREVGKKIQTEKGIENPTGDFGIQLLAGRTGIVFREGSLFANAAITRDVDNGRAAFRQVLGAVESLSKKQPEKITAGNAVLRGLLRIGQLQRMSSTVLTMQLARHGNAKPRAAQMDEATLAVLETIDSEARPIEGITVFGRLRQLTDRAIGSTPQSIRLWGGLIADDGEQWRIKFTEEQYQKALSLFTKQVEVRGTATYYRTSTPSLRADHLNADEPRDYVAAFDEMLGSEKDLYGEESTESLIDEARGAHG